MSDEDPTARVDALETRYRARFAGHARVTRDPDELEQMLADLAAIGATGALAERAANLRELWTTELEQIRAARAVPYAVPVARLRTWGDLTLSRYSRGFAGYARDTRDLGLLLEITADLRGIRDAMAVISRNAPDQGLGRTLATYEQQLTVHLGEVDAIRGARRTGTQAEQGTRLAQLANQQFALYERHFAGQPRISRRPGTLERIIASLDEIRRQMAALEAAGFDEANNKRNMGVVDSRIRSFGAELDAIRKARADAELGERVSALASAANDVFGKYREAFAGKDRGSVDPDVLDQLFELLWPIAREMDEIDAEHDDDTNHRNLQLVVDNAVLYAREYDAIRAARAAATRAAPPSPGRA